jgi:aromatic ring-opening dioxygenase catalytic subunit (LigB family)
MFGSTSLQVSVLASQDPHEHLAMGKALAPLRDEGVLIVGSGLSYHNMRSFMYGNAAAGAASEEFDGWLRETCVEVATPSYATP